MGVRQSMHCQGRVCGMKLGMRALRVPQTASPAGCVQDVYDPGSDEL